MTQPPDDQASFARWLKRCRRALDLTQDELAARVGYASPTLQKIERGMRRPSRELAERLANALAIPDHERDRFLRLARVGQAQPAAQEPEPRPAGRAARPPMPTPPAALIGREAEQAALIARLGGGHQRLISLVGPGGIGKTSLALHASAALANQGRFRDGVALALLAPIGVAEDVPLAIVEALGAPIHGGAPVADQLVDALRERELLLMLDNLEHLLGQRERAVITQLLGRVLAEAPGVCLLATSRERLRMRDEWVIDLGGLATPPSDAGPRVERAAAVQLFVERAQRAVTTFALGAHNRAAVARICRQLEGLPLAIELAASWTRALAPHEIAAELERSIDLLASDSYDTPDRHRSLRAALDHSWQLLDPAERLALARMSVFHSGCERDAARAVIGATLPILTALIDKSLLRATAAPGTTAARYALHELVRQYAAERLSSDEQQTTAARHATYYAALLQRTIVAHTGGSAPDQWAELVGNIDNLRAAWGHAAATGNGPAVIAMARGIALLYDSHGWLRDAAALFERAAAALRISAPDALDAQGFVIGWQGYFLYRAGRPHEAILHMEQGVALALAAGSTEGLANLLLHLGAIEIYSARFKQARARHAEAARLAEIAGDQFTQLWLQFFEGQIALFTGDLAAAEQRFAACLDTWRSQAFSRGVVAALVFLGETARLDGRLDAAELSVRESLRISSATRDHTTVAACLRELGALALARGELDEAHYLLLESYEGMRAAGDVMYAGRSLALLVQLNAQRAPIQARQGCAELLRLARDGQALLLAEAAYGLALILAESGDPSDALAVLLALIAVPGEYATLKRAAELRAGLDRRLTSAVRARAAEHARAPDLIAWLEQLCARQPGQAVPVPEDPSLPSGAIFIAETGATLSPREVEVLTLMIGGLGNQAIADALVISLHTAKKHVASILEKLGATTRTQAALRGRALGLPPPE